MMLFQSNITQPSIAVEARRANSKKGFTLVELVVVLALFMVVIDVTVVIFISVIKNQRNILREQEFINETSYAQEYITRQLRSAVKDQVGNCLDGNAGYTYFLTRFNSQSGFYEGIKFIGDDFACREFYFQTGAQIQETINGSTPRPILSPVLDVQNLSFIINGDPSLRGVSDSSSLQPRITISMTVATQAESGAQKEKVIQTTVSGRNLNQ